MSQLTRSHYFLPFCFGRQTRRCYRVFNCGNRHGGLLILATGLFKFFMKRWPWTKIISIIKVLGVSQNMPEWKQTNTVRFGGENEHWTWYSNRLKALILFFLFFLFVLNKNIDSDSSKIWFTCLQTHVSVLTFIRYDMPKSPVSPWGSFSCVLTRFWLFMWCRGEPRFSSESSGRL